ncbi:MAG: hypothetical protein AAFX90_19605 [Pseudomonadota bacterium]
MSSITLLSLLIASGGTLLLLGSLVAAMCLASARAEARERNRQRETDAFFAPGPDNGMRVGPITTRARPSETSRPGTPQ